MKQKKVVYYGLPILGVALCLWYIKEATCDVVYTDYIRLVNSYLPDVYNPAKFLVPDVLTRIPVHYFGRMFNCLFFGYSTTFDMVLGVGGMGLAGLIWAGYCNRHQLGFAWYGSFVAVLFSLSQWEMITNGTGWGHFLAFACFYYHYTVFDRVVHQEEKKWDRLLLLLLPSVIILGVAGPYCAVYTVTMVFFYLLVAGRLWAEQRKRPGSGTDLSAMSELTEKMRYWLVCCISVMIPFCLYLWSNSYAVEDHAGAVDLSLGQALSSVPGFFPRFLMKSLASVVFGGETITGWIETQRIEDGMVYLVGLLVVAAYLLAFYGNLRFRLYEKTLLPLMLLVAGMGNHAIILVSRYIFLNENYGMSSRYALQYQVGLLGILLTFGFLWKKTSKWWIRAVVVGFCLIFLTGWAVTNYKEWEKAPDREAYAERIAQVARDFESVEDDVLRRTFDYRRSRPDSGAKVRQALTILKEQGWNVFRQP